MGLLTNPLTLGLDTSRNIFDDPSSARTETGGWDFLGSCPVPLRARMREDIALIAQAHVAAGGARLKWLMPMGQGGRTPMGRLRFIRELEEFPKLLASAEYGNAFNRAFHSAHVERGTFASLQPESSAEVFVEAGLIDPLGWIGVYAVAPFVLLIDRERLGSRPAPRSFAELTDPIYRGEVVFSGWRREGESRWRSYNLFFLVAMLRLLGETGFTALLANVPGLMHSAQMPRYAGTAASLGAVYVLPWALADLCPRRDRSEVVWPREGGLAFPLWMTAQAAHREKISPFADYFFAPATARWLDHNLYPSLAPGRPSVLPEGARLLFPGWDYLRHRSAAADAKRVAVLFHESRETLEKEGRRCA